MKLEMVQARHVERRYDWIGRVEHVVEIEPRRD